MIPDGKYIARAKSFQYGTASSGTEQVGVEYEIVDGEYAGHRITGYFSFTDAAAPYTFTKLRNSGWRGDDLEKLDCLGSVDVELVIVKDTYNGQAKTKVSFVNVPGGSGVGMKSPMTDTKSFAERMRGLTIASRKDERADAGESKSETKSAAKAPFLANDRKRGTPCIDKAIF
jgi:hypothetical protein